MRNDSRFQILRFAGRKGKGLKNRCRFSEALGCSIEMYIRLGWGERWRSFLLHVIVPVFYLLLVLLY